MDGNMISITARTQPEKKACTGMKKLKSALIAFGVSAVLYLLLALFVYDRSRFAPHTMLLIFAGACAVCGVVHAAVRESVFKGLSLALIPCGFYCLYTYAGELFSSKLTLFALLFTALMSVIDSAFCLFRQTQKGEELLSDIHDLPETPVKVLCRYIGLFFIYVMIASTIIAVF